MSLNFEGLKAHLHPSLDTILGDMFPEGTRKGEHFHVGSTAGEAGTSLDFHVGKGIWKDWALDGHDEPAKDILDLYCAARGVDAATAYRELSDRYGYSNGHAPKQRRAPRPKKPDIPAIMPPEGAAPPPERDGRWCYVNRDGLPVFYIARRNQDDGGKEFYPYRWNPLTDKWVSKAWPAPRPMYNLQALAARADATAVVVEGEATADAAISLDPPEHVVTTWSGGAAAISKTDWSPLAGRTVLLIPDADTPGRDAMRAVATRLLAMGCTVAIADPRGRPAGWDLADEEWFSWDDLASTMREFLVDDLDAYLAPEPDGIPAVAPPVAADEPDIGPDPPPHSDADRPALGKLLPMRRGGAEPAEQPAAEGAVEHWLALELDLNGHDKPHTNEYNAYQIIKNIPAFSGHLWWDEFYDDDMTDWDGPTRQIRKEDAVGILQFIQHDIGIPSMRQPTVEAATLRWVRQHPRNAPADWVRGLKWDGEKRIDGFFADALTVPTNRYSLQVSKNFWLSLVARIIWPGCKVDNMVILEGKQGVGKSSALELIGGEWYAETKNKVGQLDFYQCLQGKCIVNLDELDSFREVSQSTLKTVLSCTSDRYRASYDRKPYDRPRHNIFVGTTNKTSYLQDETGGRRYWPVRVNKVDLKLIADIREQCFAEACHRLTEGKEKWHIIDLHDAQIEQEARREIDDFEVFIHEYLRGKSEVTTAAIAVEGLGIDKGAVTPTHTRRISKSLRALNWDNKPAYDANGHRIRVWAPIGGGVYTGVVAHQQELLSRSKDDPL